MSKHSGEGAKERRGEFPRPRVSASPRPRVSVSPCLRVPASPKRLWVLTSIFCVLSVVGFALIQRQIDRIESSGKKLEEKLIYIPTGRFIRMAALGFDVVLADVLWARAVVYFGGHFLEGDKDYRWLYRILDAVTTLDPKNILAYRFGGTVLALEANRVEESIALLEKGLRNNPDEDWRLPFLLGFNYFYILDDPASAARYLEQAARIPGHPVYLPGLVARMYAKSQEMDGAIEFLQEMYRQYADQNVKMAIAERITILAAKKQIPSLEYAVEKYKAVHGRYPRELEALIHEGLIRQLPEYVGGQYIIDPDTGKVDWVSESNLQWP